MGRPFFVTFGGWVLYRLVDKLWPLLVAVSKAITAASLLRVHGFCAGSNLSIGTASSVPNMFNVSCGTNDLSLVQLKALHVGGIEHDLKTRR